MGKPKAVRKSRSAKKTATSDREDSGAESPASPKPKTTPKGRKSRAKAASTTKAKAKKTPKPRAGRPKSVDRGTPTRGAAKPAKKETPATKKDKKSSGSDTEYDVERILDSKGKPGTGGEEYLIKWVGYSKDEATWEPASALENCPDLLEKYLDKLNKIMDVDERDLRVSRKQTERYMPAKVQTGVRSSKRFSGSPRKVYREED